MTTALALVLVSHLLVWKEKKSFPSLTWQVFHSPNKDSAAKLYKKAEMDSTPKKHKQWNLD